MTGIEDGLGRVETGIGTLADDSQKTLAEIKEIRKLYHTEFAGRLQTMQTELDRYHEIDRGRAFDSILTSVAKLYNDHYPILKQISDKDMARKVEYIFLDFADLLAANGVSQYTSKPGDKRNPKYCQILSRVPTTDPTLHDTVIESRSTGFFVENRVLARELVSIYIYTDPDAATPAQE